MTQSNCCICDSNDWQTLYHKEVLHPLWWLNDNHKYLKLRYVICRNCEYIKLHPMLNFDEYEVHYRQSPGLAQDAFDVRTPIIQERKDFILQYINGVDYDTVLEVGPAYGDLLLILTEFDKRIGIEPSSTYFDHVKSSNLPLEYHTCMLEQVPHLIPALLNSANLILACHVLEHAVDPRNFINHLLSLAKPGGYLFIEVPSVEAMSQCQQSIFQTLHFGHVSQFSISVINRLCISLGLEAIKVESTTKHDYPIIRALYRKAHVEDEVAKLFVNHCDSVDAGAARAKRILLDELNRASLNPLIVWGCGQDLLDILVLLNDSERQLFHKKAYIVDVNTGKQNKELDGFQIHAPETFSSSKVDSVVVTSRSQLIQSDIAKSANKLFPEIKNIRLYPLNG